MINREVINRESSLNKLNLSNITISVPFENNGINGWFSNINNTKDAILQDLKAFIFTNKNERVMRPTFGIDLKKYVFEQNTSDIEEMIFSDIKYAIQTYFPFVNVKRVKINSAIDSSLLDENSINLEISLEIKYSSNEIDQLTIEKKLKY